MNPPSIKAVSAEQIRAVIKYLPIFENINPDDFAHMIPPRETTKKVSAAKQQQTDDGVYWEANIGNLEYHQAVYEFMKACYANGFVQPFDWPAWAKEASRYMDDPALVASARLTTCIKLITASLRYERFCDGHLGEVLVSGHITAILRRLKQLADARLETTKVD